MFIWVINYFYLLLGRSRKVRRRVFWKTSWSWWTELSRNRRNRYVWIIFIIKVKKWLELFLFENEYLSMYLSILCTNDSLVRRSVVSLHQAGPATLWQTCRSCLWWASRRSRVVACSQPSRRRSFRRPSPRNSLYCWRIWVYLTRCSRRRLYAISMTKCDETAPRSFHCRVRSRGGSGI